MGWNAYTFAKSVGAALAAHGYDTTPPFRDVDVPGAWIIGISRKPPPPKRDYAGRPMRRDWSMSDLQVGTLAVMPNGEVRCDDTWGATCKRTDLDAIDQAVRGLLR